MGDVTAVVTSHDAGDLLRPTLQGLFDSGELASVHLLDSGSTDGSLVGIEEEFPDLVVTRFEANVGPCVTRNRGAREARTPYVLFVDDDMRLEPGAVTRLRDVLEENPRVAMAGARVHYAGDGEIIQYDGGIWHYSGLPHMRYLGFPADTEPPLKVDVLVTSCLMVRRDVWMEVGGLREELFYLTEDTEISLRLRYLGWELAQVSEARTWNAGASEGLSLRRGVKYPSARVYYHSRNRCLLVLSHYHVLTLIALGPALLFFELAWFVFATLSGQPLAYLRGKLGLVFFVGHVRRWRREMAGRRVLRDRDLLGAPSLSFTPTALEQPLARAFAGILDGVMRMFWAVARGIVP